jgi:uracil-DNA glycosylase family 4
MLSFSLPAPDCPLCPRLCSFREQNNVQYPHFFNAPVTSFGSLDARLLVVGLAPGLKGANQTGRPFTGDYAGKILYASLHKSGLTSGAYKERADDGFTLVNVRVTNAVRCVPQENKPETSEIKQCNNFLKNEIAAMPNLKAILALGGISHGAVLTACGEKKSAAPFGHAAEYNLKNGITLLTSYHTSRYNINVGTLTQEMFDAVVERAKILVGC